MGYVAESSKSLAATLGRDVLASAPRRLAMLEDKTNQALLPFSLLLEALAPREMHSQAINVDERTYQRVIRQRAAAVIVTSQLPDAGAKIAVDLAALTAEGVVAQYGTLQKTTVRPRHLSFRLASAITPHGSELSAAHTERVHGAGLLSGIVVAKNQFNLSRLSAAERYIESDLLLPAEEDARDLLRAVQNQELNPELAVLFADNAANMPHIGPLMELQ